MPEVREFLECEIDKHYVPSEHLINLAAGSALSVCSP